MAAQKCKNKFSVDIFGTFECLLPQNPSNQSSQLSWFSSRPNGRLSQN